tara:strand:- start:30566 stop:31651 length:1086 start_codon:yes stop_codon:yes gene_type:complete
LTLHEGIYNFSSGPACLPLSVLEDIKKDIPDWHSGMSVMEVSHRSESFLSLKNRVETSIKQLLNIPDDFCILLMHGGARMQFSAIGLNLFYQESVVNFLITGHWSHDAFQEASKYVSCHVAAHAEQNGYTMIPPYSDSDMSEQSKFLYYTDNETIHGIEFLAPPRTRLGLIADMTSSILTKKIDFEQHDLIYASAQKNLGIAGVTLVIVRKSLLGQAHPLTPSVLNYKITAEKGSLYNTPPVFAIYVLDLILEWVKTNGGLPACSDMANRRSNMLYNMIDNSHFYQNKVSVEVRSRMNVPFSLPSPALESKFVLEAEQQGLMFLKGHRAVGGCRASLYNAMPEAGVAKLVTFMQQFESQNK